MRGISALVVALFVLCESLPAAADPLHSWTRKRRALPSPSFWLQLRRDRAITTIRDRKLDSWTHPLRVPAEGSDYVLDHTPQRKAWNPAPYTLAPADQFDIKGNLLSQHLTKDGIGAPLVAVAVDKNPMPEKPSAPGGRASLRAALHGEPALEKTTTLEGRKFPLAADYTVPLGSR
ncbi:MAG TPA: hypothetical protein VIS96_06150 [Terrimicrobiaceae bacterium]